MHVKLLLRKFEWEVLPGDGLCAMRRSEGAVFALEEQHLTLQQRKSA